LIGIVFSAAVFMELMIFDKPIVSLLLRTSITHSLNTLLNSLRTFPFSLISSQHSWLKASSTLASCPPSQARAFWEGI
jgi:hypothetical protein